MEFKLLDSLSLPGDAAKPNEDFSVAGATVAAVFDGATGLGERLMPGPSDAQWIAQFGARRFRAHSESGRGAIRDWLRGAAGDAEKSYKALRKRPPTDNYEVAYASAVMTAIAGDVLTVLWFGDCALLAKNQAGEIALLGDTMNRRDGERARVTRLMKPDGRGPAAAGVRDEFLPALRAQRNLVNTATEWLFAPDAACADHAKEARLVVVAGAHLLLASDGFLALASDYGCYTVETLFSAAVARGLAPLGQELRALEASDPEGLRYPRFKRCDDATALLLALEA